MYVLENKLEVSVPYVFPQIFVSNNGPVNQLARWNETVAHRTLITIFNKIAFVRVPALIFHPPGPACTPSTA